MGGTKCSTPTEALLIIGLTRKQSYRLGYAESNDGLDWTRRDDEVGISKSEGGWDSEMLEYCSLYQHNGQRFMLYNGNGFGQSGFGYAVLDR